MAVRRAGHETDPALHVAHAAPPHSLGHAEALAIGLEAPRELRPVEPEVLEPIAVDAALVLGVRSEPALHRRLGRRREREAEEIVDAPDLLHGIRDEVRIRDVVERARAAPSRTDDRPRHRPHGAVGELRADLARIDAVAEDRAPVGHHAAIGRHHPRRVAVGLDDLRVGEDVEQRVEVLEVMRRLAEPASGALPQQKLDRRGGSSGRRGR